MQTSLSTPTINKKNARPSRCQRTLAGKTARCPTVTHPFGFLNHPVRSFITERHAELQDQRKVEASFMQSVREVCKLYEFPVLSIGNDGYPASLAKVFNALQGRLAGTDEPAKLLAVQADNGKVHLTTYQSLDSGWNLYYIPVQPLWDLMRSKQRPDLSRLLLSVFSYLLKAGIPFYADETSYLYDQYQMIEQWLLDCQDEPEYTQKQLEQVERATAAGKVLLKRLKLDCHLKQFHYRLQNMKITSPSDMDVWETAKGFYELWQTYPTCKVFDNVGKDFMQSAEEEYDYVGRFCEQVSFIWSEFDDFDKQVIESVNVSLQECSQFEEPVSFQHFDRPQDRITLNLQFEKTLFDLIDSLIYRLYRL